MSVCMGSASARLSGGIDHEQRQVLWMAYNLLDKIKGHLVTVMETGNLAASELENLTRQTTKE